MKTHFLVSETPQKFAPNTQVLCGKTLANPQPIIMVDVGEPGLLAVTSFSDCSTCLQRSLEMPKDDGKRYFYILIEAQEAKNAQAESAA